MKIKSFDKTEIFYIKHKPKKRFPYLVFIHGWLANHTFWEKELQYFKKKGYGILTLDLRGFGNSDLPKRKISIADMAKDLNKILNKEKISKAILIGHSMGGMVGLSLYELAKNKVKALILAESSYKRPLAEGPLKPISSLIVKSLDLMKIIRHNKTKVINFKNGHWNDFKVVIKGLIFTNPRAYDESLHSMLKFDKRKILEKITIPTLIIASDKDPLFTLPTEKKMNKKIKSSKLDIIHGEHVAVLNKSKLIEKHIELFLNSSRISK